MLRNSNENSNLSANGQVPVNRIVSLLPKDWRRGNRLLMLLCAVVVAAVLALTITVIVQNSITAAEEAARQAAITAENDRIRYAHFAVTSEHVERIERSLFDAKEAVDDGFFEQASPHLTAAADEIELLRDHIKSLDPFVTNWFYQGRFDERKEKWLNNAAAVVRSIAESADAGAVSGEQQNTLSTMHFAFDRFGHVVNFNAEKNDGSVDVGYISDAAYSAALTAIYSRIKQIEP